MSERGASKTDRGKHGFSKDSRVRKRREYQDIQARGRRVSSAHFVLILVMRDTSARASHVCPHPGVTRLGITASRKVGSAVVRNRMKRLVRHAFVEVRDWFPNELDVVVVVRSAWPEAKVEDVISEWRSVDRNLRKQIQEARKLSVNARASSTQTGGSSRNDKTGP
ncbi:MAG TPA: ribonuclease P protein component [Polyangiaceae bacterium]|nr:ribonuclease P protein component [Polyangiaceae bacterium]